MVRTDVPVYCYHPKLGPAGLVPHLSGRRREDAEAADRVQHGRGRGHGRAHVRRESRRRPARRARIFAAQSSAGLSDLRQGRRVRSARLLDGLRSRRFAAGRSESAEAEGRRPRPDDRARRRTLHRLPALLAFRRDHHPRAFAGRQGPGPARRDRDGLRRTVRLEFQRQRDRVVPGRRAHLEDLSLQIAAVGPAAHGDDLHAVRRRLRAQRRRASRRRAAHDVVDPDDAISDGWLCDRGRYNVGFYATRAA